MSELFFDVISNEYEIGNDDEKAKIVYATFGMACYWCQCIEQSFALMLMAKRIVSGKLTSQKEVDAVIDAIEQSKATMGNILNEVTKEYCLPKDFKIKLTDILKRRNFIVHKFFKENSVKWYSNTGRIEMVKLLANFIDEAREVDETLQLHYIKYFDVFGKGAFVEETHAKMKLEEALRDS